MLGKTLADLQSNISISAQNAVTGDINWVTGYTGFSSNFREQAGWYIALKIDASTIEGALEGATIVSTYHGRDVTLDSDQIIIIRLADGEDTITFTANKEGYTEGRLTLDFSGLDKQEVNQTVYLTSETTGITISPMQFGNTKTISGQVPWDSTTNSNVMQLTAYPFFDVPSGTTYSLEGTYNGVGANIQITDGTFSDLDELDLTFSVPSEMIGQTGATFILMFEDPDNNRDYFTYDVTGLTLAPDPTPRMNITSGDSKTTITPATFNVAKTATGQVPYDTINSYNHLVLGLNYTGTWDQNYYKIVAYDNNATQIWNSPVYTGDSNLPIVIGINPITASNIGTGKYIDVTIYSGETAQTQSTAVNTIRIDTSALTLEAAPSPEINITSDTTNVTISPSTYATSKTATGQVPYDTTTQKNILSVALTTSGTLPAGPYTIEVFAQGDVMQQPIWYTTGASTIPQSIPIPLTSNEVGTGKYITINISGANDPEFVIITINTSALTLESAPTPPTPSTPNFDLIGFEEGEAWDIYTLQNYDDQTTHYINAEDACTLDISYVNQETVSGHTKYNYSAADDGDLFLGLKIWNSTPYGVKRLQNGSESSYTAILSRESSISAASSNTLATTGEFLSGEMANQYILDFGKTTNAFVCFYCNFSNEHTYHYLAPNSANIGQGTLQDISSAQAICFILAGATAQNIPQNNLVFKLYNSDGSDYIIVNIDMSNVSLITTWQS